MKILARIDKEIKKGYLLSRFYVKELDALANENERRQSHFLALHLVPNERRAGTLYVQQLLQIKPKHSLAEQTVEKRHGESCSKAHCAQTSHLRVANTARWRQSDAAKRGQVFRKMLKRLARRSDVQPSLFCEDVSLSLYLEQRRWLWQRLSK